jgi:hypothetical protein
VSDYDSFTIDNVSHASRSFWISDVLATSRDIWCGMFREGRLSSWFLTVSPWPPAGVSAFRESPRAKNVSTSQSPTPKDPQTIDSELFGSWRLGVGRYLGRVFQLLEADQNRSALAVTWAFFVPRVMVGPDAALRALRARPHALAAGTFASRGERVPDLAAPRGTGPHVAAGWPPLAGRASNAGKVLIAIVVA